jgi:hypothetical protein
MHNVFERAKWILMRPWARALSHFTKILPKIDVILEIWVIEKMHSTTLFLAKSLCVS